MSGIYSLANYNFTPYYLLNKFNWEYSGREVKLYNCLPGILGIKDELAIADLEGFDKTLSKDEEIWPGLNLNGDDEPTIDFFTLFVKGSGGLWSNPIF